MYLKSLYLRNFRNFSESEISFTSGLNVIWGGNAQGKTNLLEAVCLLSTGRSDRCQHLPELIKEGEAFFYLEAEIEQNLVSQSIKLFFDGKVKRLQLNANSYVSFNPLLGILPLILHAPDDSDLITGSPALRRRFLNLHLSQSDLLYVHHLSRFWRAMKQRNCLLRAKTNEPIDGWESEMAISAAYLYKARTQLLDELKAPLAVHGRSLSSDSELHELRHHPSASVDYLRQLEKSRARDRELGMTSTGPHRDDISFWISGKAARLFASEGQKKTAIASLRLAEWTRMSQRLSCKPLIAIDDLGLPLDDARQARFQDSLRKLGQVFITTPSPTLDFPSQNKIRILSGAAAQE